MSLTENAAFTMQAARPWEHRALLLEVHGYESTTSAP